MVVVVQAITALRITSSIEHGIVVSNGNSHAAITTPR
jgi:hypothetical protein